MADPRVIDMFYADNGMVARVRRVDGSEVRCKVIVNGDGSMGLKPPRGEWLIEPPPKPMVGQSALADVGEAAAP